MLTLPYCGKKGEQLLKVLKKDLRKVLPENIQTNIVYTNRKLSSFFLSKDKTKLEHRHNIVYMAKCPEPSCDANYIGEAGRRILERVNDHNGRDNKSHLLKHSMETNHTAVTLNDFKILGSGYSYPWQRKISEALFIKTFNPPLNVQEKSVPLKLFN